jgi:hypothetical protein
LPSRGEEGEEEEEEEEDGEGGRAGDGGGGGGMQVGPKRVLQNKGMSLTGTSIYM